MIINCGALPCLLNLLQTSHKKSIKKEACWTISNITAGTKDQIQAVIDSHILPPLVQVRRMPLALVVHKCRKACMGTFPLKSRSSSVRMQDEGAAYLDAPHAACVDIGSFQIACSVFW